MPPALFIGRFQPFHLGHLDALNQIFEKEEEVIIAIGSAADEFTVANPFRASERDEMIRAATEKWKSKITITLVPDINHHALWVDHVKRLVPAFGQVYTGSPLTTELFEQAGIPVVQIEKNKSISATTIRELMASAGKWEDLVPIEVATYLKKIDATDRIKHITN